ncbi:hypothetical protein NP493_2g08028 [Ridgeia piscesae]|uniref:Harmonin-binding protein USHBP1 PDZ-binding domain-containing protein n=1 Tax=Ridgeia piscesae TaxID=27915 RepID=A0AAD9PGA1_RIDPI|nr:hypothetical protein NP493_2g08028 [Ridgeia piscesae]
MQLWEEGMHVYVTGLSNLPAHPAHEKGILPDYECNLIFKRCLHLAALTALKGEILDLTDHLQRVRTDKELVERQLNRLQTERLRQQREGEDRLEQQAARYEDRLTELHSVIAELRKKLDRYQISVIREENEEAEHEYEEIDEDPHSTDLVSVNENNANRSQLTADVSVGPNAASSQATSELETPCESREENGEDVNPEEGEGEQLTGDIDSGVEGNTVQHAPQQMARYRIEPPVVLQSTCELHQQVALQASDELRHLQEENGLLQQQVGRQEADVNKLRSQLHGYREERDRLRRQVRELQTRLQSLEAVVSPHNSRTSTPTKAPLVARSVGDRSASGGSMEQVFPIAKMAELKKLKTGSGDRHVLGAEISSVGLPNAKVAEHLAQSLQECSNVQEMIQTLSQSGDSIDAMSVNTVREFEIELETLQSKVDHLKSQNDLLTLTLEESKAHCDHVTMLIGKYESNGTAFQLALNYSDQALDAHDVLVDLLESERAILIANSRFANSDFRDDQSEMTEWLKRAHRKRRSAEHSAKQLLHRLDRCGNSNHSTSDGGARPWEELSSTSRTASTCSSTASSIDTDFTKVDEQKLRNYIQQLKSDRAAVKLTVTELESVHLDPLGYDDVGQKGDTQRLDLENAVLMQELMALKEEKAELKALNYLLEKEKGAMQLQLSGKESQEHAYLIQIDHLKSEITEQTRGHGKSYDMSNCSEDVIEVMRREKKLKERIQELVITLEKLSKNSEIRHQQSAEFINDLKRANSALVSAFEKAKRKYQGKVKKLEGQVQVLTERYETQIRVLKQKISRLEEQSCRHSSNETSL